jgi:glycosyltransferase involved in cell wall biosynthesis
MAEENSRTLTPQERDYFDANPGGFFLCAGALVPYKRIDVAVEAFSALKERLVVVGSGPDFNKLRARAGKNVEFLGRVSDAFLWECYKRCRALVFPGTEDFGIIPVECLAAGKPVIGLDAGGLRESSVGFRPWQDSELVPSRHTGVCVPKEGSGSVEALTHAVELFIQLEGGFTSETLQARARLFSYSEFFRAWSGEHVPRNRKGIPVSAEML